MAFAVQGRWGIVCALGLLVTLSATFCPLGASAAPMNGWADVAAHVLPATVSIRVVKIALGDADPETGRVTIPGDRNRFAGSGFIVDSSGIIVTNKHLVAGALWITVRFQDGAQTTATVFATSPLIDLALLKVNVGHKLPVLRLGSGDAARPGDPVLAIGDPLGVGISLSAGIVSGIQRDLMSTPFDDYVQTDAAINHGNSGGPLMNTDGQVIGVNTILFPAQPGERASGLGFAISSNILAHMLSRALHPEQQHVGWIGVHLQGMTQNLAEAMRLPEKGIAIVTEVDADSPASGAGLQPGDIILRYGNETPLNARVLMREIALTPIGAMRVLQVWSAGRVREISLAIHAWPGIEGPQITKSATIRDLPPLSPDFGLLLAPISPLARQAYHLGKGPGVLVVAVDRMSEAFSRGLQPGMVIERIADQPVTTPQDAERLLALATHRAPLVALLVRWVQGPIWITLHTGYRPGDSAGAPPGDIAPAAEAAQGASDEGR